MAEDPSENKINNTSKSLLPIVFLAISFFAAGLVISIMVISATVGDNTIAAAAGGNNTTTAAGGNYSHANNETSANGNISSIPGTSQIVGDRRHAPM
jgi:hypothetical protein